MNNFTVGIIQSLLGSRQVEYIEQYITIGGMVTSLRFLLSSAIAMTVLSRCAITISSIALLPSQMVGYNLPRLKELRDDFIAKHQVEKDIYEVSIEVKKQIELNALVVKSKSKNFPSWMLYLNANGMVYEDVLRSANDLADSLNRNLILVNFRGVGKSQGKSEKALHLVEDCIACLNYLKNLGIKEENILIWGHSIGGAVAIVAANHVNHKGPVFADRTFQTLVEVIKVKIREGPIAPICAGLLGIAFYYVFAFVHLCTFGYSGVWPTLKEWKEIYAIHNPWAARAILSGLSASYLASVLLPVTTFVRAFLIGSGICIVGGDVLDVVFGAHHLSFLPFMTIVTFTFVFQLGLFSVFNSPLVLLVQFLGWKMDPGKAWASLKSKHKASSFHRRDEMIPFHLSMRVVDGAAHELTGGIPLSMQMQPQQLGPVCHMYSPTIEEWRALGVIDALKGKE